MTRRHTVLIALVIASVWLITGCGTKSEPQASPQAEGVESASRVAFTLGTVAELRAYGPGAEEAVDAVVAELERLTAALDRFSPGSDVYRVNAAAGEWVRVGSETLALTRTALEIARMTDGAFDPTVAPLVDLWGFVEVPDSAPAEGQGPTALLGRRPPEDAEIRRLLPHVGYEFVEVDEAGSRVRLTDPEAELDFGAIAKGYAADRAAAVLKEHGIDSAFVNLGGDIFVVGGKPDGSPWRIAIQHPRPRGPNDFIGVVSVKDRSVVTSGDYERYFEYEGVRYTHLIDPRTGYPQQELASITVVAPTGTQADALATAVAVMGMEKGLEFLESLPDVEGLLVGVDGRMGMTSGMEKMVELRK